MSTAVPGTTFEAAEDGDDEWAEAAGEGAVEGSTACVVVVDVPVDG
ncbi:hypothetical protein [Streptomyces broussonetiae]